MACNDASAINGLNYFLVAYDCRQFRWLTHTISAPCEFSVGFSNFRMCFESTKNGNTKRNMKSKRSNILDYFDAPVKRFQWDFSLDLIASVSFFRILSGETLTQSIPCHPLTFELANTYVRLHRLIHGTWKGTNERNTTSAVAAVAAATTIANAWCAQNLTAFLFEILLHHYRLSCFSSLFLLYFLRMSDEDINMSTKIETKCVCVWLDIIGILSL